MISLNKCIYTRAAIDKVYIGFVCDLYLYIERNDKFSRRIVYLSQTSITVTFIMQCKALNKYEY